MNKENIWQFVKFGIVGFSNTIISYVIYLLTLMLLQKGGLLPKLDYLAAQLAGFLISVLWSFYWNRKYVFQTENSQIPWYKSLVKTYVSYAFTGIFLNSMLSILWVEKFRISKVAAPIFNLMISVPLNFLMNKFWAFKNNE